jgi:hypothetical protein
MDHSLMLLAKEIRTKTLKILDGLTDAEAHFKAPNLDNSILWHAGHSYCVVESLATARIANRPAEYPPAWFETFSWKSTPATVTTWPTLAEVRDKLTDQIAKLLPQIESLSEDQLSKIIDPTRNATLRWAIIHAFQDEAGHQGEMHLLKKMLKKQLS